MKLVNVTVVLAMELPDGDTSNADSFAADATNELLREHQQSFSPASSLIDYAIKGQGVVELPFGSAEYEEGDAFVDHCFSGPRPDPASITMKEKTLKSIVALTQSNNHGEAYRLAARALGNKNLTAKFDDINRRQKAAGSLSLDLYEERHRVYLELLNCARRALAPAQYQQLYMAF